MVRAVWQSYFAAAGVGRGGSGDGEAPVGDASSAVVAAKAIPLKVYAKAGMRRSKPSAAAAHRQGRRGGRPQRRRRRRGGGEAEGAGRPLRPPLLPRRPTAAPTRAPPRPSPPPPRAPRSPPRSSVLPLPGPIDASPLGVSGPGPVAFFSKALIGEKGSRGPRSLSATSSRSRRASSCLLSATTTTSLATWPSPGSARGTPSCPRRR